MADDRDAGVDPRFDPLFQRGYDPARHRTRVRHAPKAEVRADTVPARSPAREPVVAAPEPETAPVVSPGAAPAEEAEYVAPRRNPFRLILLLVSLAAIVGAAVLLWQRIRDDPYGGYGGYGGDVGKVFVQQFIDALLTPLLTGGLLGLCLWLALGALRRRDRG